MEDSLRQTGVPRTTLLDLEAKVALLPHGKRYYRYSDCKGRKRVTKTMVTRLLLLLPVLERESTVCSVLDTRVEEAVLGDAQARSA